MHGDEVDDDQSVTTTQPDEELTRMMDHAASDVEHESTQETPDARAGVDPYEITPEPKAMLTKPYHVQPTP